MIGVMLPHKKQISTSNRVKLFHKKIKLHCHISKGESLKNKYAFDI